MSYQKWISVNLEHAFFADLRCPLLKLELTDDCREQMRRRGQFFYPMPNGFFIFQDTSKIKDDQNGSETSCFFDIAVYPEDGLFGNYSNLELDYRRGAVYYIGNSLKTGPDNGKRLTLTDRASGGEIEGVPVLIKPEQFVISLAEAASGDTFRLLDRSNAVVKEQQVKEKNGGAGLYADVSGRSAGLYSLEKNGAVTAYFYADDSLYNKKPAFIIGIEAVWKKDAAMQTYDIRIANRVVSWEYHVFARANGRKLKNLEIKNNNEKLLPGVSFEQVRLDEERKEAVFVSNTDVPIAEKAYQSIELIEKGNNGTPLVPHMPNAGISTLHVKEGKWVSQMYVYI
ncbi:MAG: hypothetical protein GY950_34770 [bacterium]|nr:hypothetical protein [bacterium]